MMQEKLPYHINGVRSNDELYAEADFKAKVVNCIDELLKDIKKTTGEVKDKTMCDLYVN